MKNVSFSRGVVSVCSGVPASKPHVRWLTLQHSFFTMETSCLCMQRGKLVDLCLRLGQ